MQSRVLCFPYNNLPLQLWENCVPHSSNGTQNISFPECPSYIEPIVTRVLHPSQAEGSIWRQKIHSLVVPLSIMTQQMQPAELYLVGKSYMSKFVDNLIHQYFFTCLQLCIGQAEQVHYRHLIVLHWQKQGPCIGCMCKQQQQILTEQLLRTPRVGIISTFSDSIGILRWVYVGSILWILLTCTASSLTK